jgi:hypothetical protein
MVMMIKMGEVDKINNNEGELPLLALIMLNVAAVGEDHVGGV